MKIYTENMEGRQIHKTNVHHVFYKNDGYITSQQKSYQAATNQDCMHKAQFIQCKHNEK